jgi:hypothetical protein
VTADDRERVDAVAVACERAVDDDPHLDLAAAVHRLRQGAVGAIGSDLRRRQPHARGRRQALETSVVGAVPLARRTVLVDHHVPELAAVARGAVVQAAAKHDPAPHARPEREHDHVVAALAGPDPGLGQGRHVGVVVDLHVEPEAAAHLGREGDVHERHVDRVRHHAAALVDQRRQAEANGGDPVPGGDPPHELLDLHEQAILPGDVGRCGVTSQELELRRNQRRLDGCAAQIDADDGS